MNKYRFPIVSLALALYATAVPVVQSAEPANKAVVVSAPTPPTAGTLSFMVEPTQASFNVGEPIRFQMVSNDKYFLYVYSIDGQGKTTLIAPRDGQSPTSFQKDKMVVFPGKDPAKDIVFASDRPGSERIVFVASRKPIDLEAARRAKPALKDASLTDQFAALGIIVEGPAPVRSADSVVKQLSVAITPKARDANATSPAPAAPATNQTPPNRGPSLPFVSLDRTQYAVGEPMQIIYGATANGFVHLYVREPGGQTSALKSTEVEANRAYRLAANTENPAGDHELIALFTSGAVAPTPPTAASAAEVASKGVTLDASATQQHGAVYRFYVRSR